MPPSSGDKQGLIKPPPLKTGDHVGIISPAGPVETSQVSFGINYLESKGFAVHLAPHVYDQDGYFAGNDRNRLSDLHAMFEDPEIKALFCTRGGYGTLRFLHEIDYALIRRHPKILVGYSDITALMMALYTQIGLVTFHGPMVARFASSPDNGLAHLTELLSGREPVIIRGEGGQTLFEGRASGPVVGGNLTVLCHLLGTPFFPPLDGAILFLEERGEAIYRIDRMLTHLAQAGKLSGLAGVVGGQFLDCGDVDAVNECIASRFTESDIPVMTGLPMGHGSLNLTIPIGIDAEMDTGQMTLKTVKPHVLEA